MIMILLLLLLFVAPIDRHRVFVYTMIIIIILTRSKPPTPPPTDRQHTRVRLRATWDRRRSTVSWYLLTTTGTTTPHGYYYYCYYYYDIIIYRRAQTDVARVCVCMCAYWLLRARLGARRLGEGCPRHTDTPRQSAVSFRTEGVRAKIIQRGRAPGPDARQLQFRYRAAHRAVQWLADDFQQ